MKTKIETTYICEKCGAEYDSESMAILCEQSHVSIVEVQMPSFETVVAFNRQNMRCERNAGNTPVKAYSTAFPYPNDLIVTFSDGTRGLYSLEARMSKDEWDGKRPAG